MTYDITIDELSPQPVISIRESLAQPQLSSFFGRTFTELYAHLGRHGIPPRGEPFVVYHAFGPETIDVEACLPVPTEVAATNGIGYRVLPAVTVAETIHVGPYDQLGRAYQALDEWASDHAFETAGPARERYLDQPQRSVSQDALRTIVQLPIARPVAAVGSSGRSAP